MLKLLKNLNEITLAYFYDTGTLKNDRFTKGSNDSMGKWRRSGCFYNSG